MEAGATQAWGIDSSPEMLAGAKTLAQEMQVQPAFICADVLSTPLVSQCTDVVISADLIEHLNPAETIPFLQECYRLLCPGGRLVIHTWPNKYSYLFETRVALFLIPFASLPPRVFERIVELMDTAVCKAVPSLKTQSIGWSPGHSNLLTDTSMYEAATAAGLSEIVIECMDLYRGYPLGENIWRRRGASFFHKHKAFCPNLLLTATKH